MLTQKSRPTKFSQVVGQDIPVQVMKRAAAEPEDRARVYLFHGFYGCGKTTLARVFAKALNCERPGVEPCGECEACRTPMDGSPYYQEYDCSSTGSVDDARRIKENIVMDSSLARYRVVVFDEFHASSKQAQSALLKVLEEMSSNTFVVFCTTEHDKVLPTIRSRAVELFFRRLSKEVVVDLLGNLAEREGLEVAESTIDTIAKATRGHARDAVKSLELAASSGCDAATLHYALAEGAARDALAAVKSGSEDAFADAVDRSIAALRSKFTSALHGVVYGMLKPGEEPELSSAWGSDALRLFKLLMQPWAAAALKGDTTAASLLWVVWFAFGKSKKKERGGDAERGRDRFGVKR